MGGKHRKKEGQQGCAVIALIAVAATALLATVADQAAPLIG
ncbi:hypothetical protein ACPZ19_16525 [Amycolatopsis lurida]